MITAISYHLTTYLTAEKACAIYLYPTAYYVRQTKCQLYTEGPFKVGLYKVKCPPKTNDKYYSLYRMFYCSTDALKYIKT